MDASRRVPRYFRVCALLLAGCWSVAGHAQESRGPYIGIALHRATFDFDGTLATPGFEGNDVALKLLGGHRLTERFAIEATYLDIRDERGGAVGAGASEAEFAALTVAAARIWAVGKFDVRAKAGLSYWREVVRHASEPAFRDELLDPFVGAGIEYRFGKLALRADFDLLPLRVADSLGAPPKGGGWVETFSVGAVWRLR
ncbi:MAG TPA: outer membrane beta-barrel protein [Gammaproteobacteria bacterium]